MVKPKGLCMYFAASAPYFVAREVTALLANYSGTQHSEVGARVESSPFGCVKIGPNSHRGPCGPSSSYPVFSPPYLPSLRQATWELAAWMNGVVRAGAETL